MIAIHYECPCPICLIADAAINVIGPPYPDPLKQTCARPETGHGDITCVMCGCIRKGDASQRTSDEAKLTEEALNERTLGHSRMPSF